MRASGRAGGGQLAVASTSNLSILGRVPLWLTLAGLGLPRVSRPPRAETGLRMWGARLGSHARAPVLLTREEPCLSWAEELGADSDLGAGEGAGTLLWPRQEACRDAGHLPFLIPRLRAVTLHPNLEPRQPTLNCPCQTSTPALHPSPGQQWPWRSLQEGLSASGFTKSLARPVSQSSALEKRL